MYSAENSGKSLKILWKFKANVGQALRIFSEKFPKNVRKNTYKTSKEMYRKLEENFKLTWEKSK